MKFENTRVMNFEGAFRGMRNPLNSWKKSDSYFGMIDEYSDEEDWNIADRWIQKKYPNEDPYFTFEKHPDETESVYKWLINNGILEESESGSAIVAYLGPNDMDLAQRLIKSGPEHRKFLRQIFVSVDITAPLYWWKEADTYRVGVTANSTSTMHKLASTPITLDCFETDDLQDVIIEDSDNPMFRITSSYAAGVFINWLEELRQKYNETKDKKYWKELIRWLPESWLQTRTVTMNYENIRNMYYQRKDHKLNEWSGKHTPVDQSFCQWVKELPYANELILFN